MAERLRRIGNSPSLLFEISLESDSKHEKGLAWGHLRLSLAGEVFWAGENDQPLWWTWIDLLEFLGKYWPWLNLEEAYPIPVNPLFPHLLRREAERRWEDLNEIQVETEEDAVFRFASRHDLAIALKGIFVPSVFMLRQGEQFFISSAAPERALIRPRKEIIETLETLGNYIASFAKDGESPRGQRAVKLWEERANRLKEHALPLLTGLSDEEREALQGEFSQEDFWRLDMSSPDQDSEILAAARMTRGIITTENQRTILETIRNTRKKNTPALDRLMQEACKSFQAAGKPHEQGYRLAKWLRQELKLSPTCFVDVEKVLRGWGVTIKEIDLPDCPIDAIAAWGKHHGPVILLNRGKGAKPSWFYGKRSTYAHEICHLVLDRSGALPVGEVLGGRVPEYPEKRARAFAAEFLLPRKTAAECFRRSSNLEQAIHHLQGSFKVGCALLAWQILNYEDLTLAREERINLEQIARSGAEEFPRFLRL